MTVTWEDCARYKQSVWGPCISDMTLQVGDNRMPVIRKNNYTDVTWDIKLDNIPIVVGNEKVKNDNAKDSVDTDHNACAQVAPNEDEKKGQDSQQDNSDDQSDDNGDNSNNEGQVGELKTITLKQYLQNFDKYLNIM